MATGGNNHKNTANIAFTIASATASGVARQPKVPADPSFEFQGVVEVVFPRLATEAGLRLRHIP